MRTLLDKNSKDTTALNKVVDQEWGKTWQQRGKNPHTHFVLKRHSPTSSLRFSDETETEGHLKQIGMGLEKVTLSKQEKDPEKKTDREFEARDLF